MSDTARLNLPLLAAAQAQKHVTVNEALGRLDALVQARVASRQLAAPPPDPAEGDAYIVAAGGEGAWLGKDGRIAQRFAGGWSFHQPGDGWSVYVVDEARILVFAGGGWSDLVDAAVYYPAGAGAQLKLNKPAEADTASLLLQTGYEGRAEIGLAGDDDLSVKVSADGATWVEALRVDRATGRASFPAGAVRSETVLFTADGNWVRPPWARTVRILLVGGGGGGGSGRRQAAGVERRGGGGGGAGAVCDVAFDADDLPAVLGIAVGAGGAGGAPVTVDGTDGSPGAAGGDTSVTDGADCILLAQGGGGGGGGKSGVAAGGDGGQGTIGRSSTGGSGVTYGSGASVSSLGVVPGGGGGGGGLTAAGTAGYGGAGAAGWTATTVGSRAAPGGAGGTASVAGLAGADKGWSRGCGGGGGGAGGGGASGSGGGPGGTPGGGGGGGGGNTNGSDSGAGGNGGRGEVILVVTG